MGNLSTPITVQKLQMALHAKAKTESGYRFYALYDKICREDILAHAYAQCRSNQGAPGVDGQDFADVESYGEMCIRDRPVSEPSFDFCSLPTLPRVRKRRLMRSRPELRSLRTQ